jgi:hypothetical protein
MTEPDDRKDWSVPKPADIPRPTYAPAAMAFGLTFLFWGFVNGPVILIVGLLVVTFALAGWIREMRHE